MRIVTGLALAFATLFASSADAAISAQQAASRIKAAALTSAVVADKTPPFSSNLGPLKKGTKYVRTFTLSNRRQMTLPIGGPGSTKLAGSRVNVGGIAKGQINLRTEQVVFHSYAGARNMPSPKPVTP